MQELTRLREQLNDFRLKYDDLLSEIKQIKEKYNQEFALRTKIEAKYAKIKSYVLRQEREHEIRFKELIQEL